MLLRLGPYIEPESRESYYYSSGFGIGVYDFVIDYKKIKSDSNNIDSTTAFTVIPYQPGKAFLILKTIIT